MRVADSTITLEVEILCQRVVSNLPWMMVKCGGFDTSWVVPFRTKPSVGVAYHLHHRRVGTGRVVAS